MTLIEIARGQNGYVSASQATGAGIPRRKLTEAVDRGELVQLGAASMLFRRHGRTHTSLPSTGFRAVYSPMTRRCSCMV